jgi:hypothetical protein
VRRERIGLSQRHKAWVHAGFGAAFLSGLSWIAAQLWLADGGPFGESPSPLARWSMQVHGAAAMLVLIVLGTLLPGHVQRAWRTGRSRSTGVLMLGLNGLLIASGYALYYAGAEAVRAIVSPLHWIAGLGLPALLVWHAWEGGSRRAKRTLSHRRRARAGPARGQPAAPRVTPPREHPLH